MTAPDMATVLSSAFRQLSDALHQASVACKDLEYTVPLLARSPASSAAPTAPATAAADAVAAVKKKRKRDPDEPRRPLSAYLLFTADVRKQVQKANPDMKPAEVMAKLASMWKELSDANKRVQLSFQSH
jgi:HMG (high mobility group) box